MNTRVLRVRKRGATPSPTTRKGAATITMTYARKTLYIDHSIATKDRRWQPLKSILATGRYQLALSVWNLGEIAMATDPKQLQQRVRFLESLAPVWILESLDIKRREVHDFLWNRKFGVSAPRESLFANHLSQVHAARGERPVIGETMMSWIRRFNRRKFQKTKDKAPFALMGRDLVDLP